MNGPMMAELVGGPHDGREMTVPPGLDHVRMPVPAPVAYWPVIDEPDPMVLELYQLELEPGGRPATTPGGRLRFRYHGIVKF